MNLYFSKIRVYIQSHKTFLISRGLFLLLVLLFIKVNRIQIRLNPDTEVFEKVAPVDYSVDRSRLLCYAHRVPEETQRICDNAFPEGKGE
ncbi:hypothetical protein EHQ76_07475 [Leptospira barantonii]|uniref:Uncharacterized protein n=1 Tax=Leptospira barantonii TaxID=2023184 RepID=A0A5F2BH26_9LEPT|nr:hypothetical protein EHQ76_07475 [Leptospira barantonii]